MSFNNCPICNLPLEGDSEFRVLVCRDKLDDHDYLVGFLFNDLKEPEIYSESFHREGIILYRSIDTKGCWTLYIKDDESNYVSKIYGILSMPVTDLTLQRIKKFRVLI